jgi:hypothetical protein
LAFKIITGDFRLELQAVIGVAELGYEFVGAISSPSLRLWLPQMLTGWCASATGTLFTTPERQNHTLIQQCPVILDVDSTLVFSNEAHAQAWVEFMVMIGDTPDDLQSGTGLGVELIAVGCGGFDQAQLKQAIAIYNDSADDILANYANSPLGKTKSG